MLDSVSHRGPDGSGQYVSGNLRFGHRRLSVIDVSVGGAQPMIRNGYAITYNGELYNYLELKKELEHLGYRFKSNCDTEVLLVAYIQWGSHCVERFDGMWALGIHDPLKRILFMSRDRFGEKPLHYHEGRENFLFASEPKQLRAIGIGRNADLVSVENFLSTDIEIPGSTFYSEIKELPPATVASIDLDTLELKSHTYYRPGAIKYRGICAQDVASALEHELHTSISRRLRSDVRVGILLSGGIDSSLIATVASPIYLEATKTAITAVTSSTGAASNDEADYARDVAEACGLNWVKAETGEQSTRSIWGDVTRAQDQPIRSTSVVAQYLTMNAAKTAGVTVLLDGQGADEAWLGYPRFIPKVAGSVRLGKRWPFLVNASRHLSYSPTTLLATGAYFGNPHLAASRNWIRMHRLGLHAKYRQIFQTFSNHNSSAIPIEELRLAEIADRGLQRLLQYEDRNSMAFSLESRLPYLSEGMVDLALASPLSALFFGGWTKWPLRQQLSRAVPASVAWRKSKLGFNGHPDAFQRNAPETVSLIASSPLLQHLGLKLNELKNCPEAITWRLFAVALWEEACEVGIE